MGGSRSAGRDDGTVRLRTLVLGASGFLGAHLVCAARRAGAEVVGSCRRPDRRPAGLDSVGDSDWLALDLEDAFEVSAALQELRPHTVVLAAALSRLGDCAREPERAVAVNAAAPQRVAESCSAQGARLVHVSTDLVFGGEAPAGGYREDDRPAPRSHYGATKAEGEERVLEACPAALVVRLPLLAGDSFGRDLGASDSLLAALARGEQPDLFTDEWRTPLGATAAADAVIALAGTDARGILHVAGSERLSRHDLGLRVLEAAGMSEDEAHRRVRATTRGAAGLDAERPADVSLNATRARERLGVALVLDSRELARSRDAH